MLPTKLDLKNTTVTDGAAQVHFVGRQSITTQCVFEFPIKDGVWNNYFASVPEIEHQEENHLGTSAARQQPKADHLMPWV